LRIEEWCGERYLDKWLALVRIADLAAEATSLRHLDGGIQVVSDGINATSNLESSSGLELRREQRVMGIIFCDAGFSFFIHTCLYTYPTYLIHQPDPSPLFSPLRFLIHERFDRGESCYPSKYISV
jgi:hypothetical protein